jgi:hypothetical protein
MKLGDNLCDELKHTMKLDAEERLRGKMFYKAWDGLQIRAWEDRVRALYKSLWEQQ